MIKELYLKRAVDIRKNYLKIVNDIAKYEKIALNLSDSISNRTDELKELLEKINLGKLSEESAKNELHRIVIGTEEDMNDIDKSIEKLNDSMDALKLDEIKLHKEIKQTYFTLSDEEIKKEVQDYLIKLKLI